MDGYVVIGAELNTKSFEAQIEKLEDELDTLSQEYETALKDAEFPEDQLIKYRQEIEKTKNKIIELKKKQDALNKSDFSNITSGINNIGGSITKTIKKISKWALAVFGLRSAYMAVRNAINVLTGDDEQLKADIDYIKSAIAYTLEPIVRGIVELAKQLMYYVGYIIRLWTGKNIFENANKSLSSANKNAKSLQKIMYGFDKINKANSQNGISGSVSPSFDLSNLDSITIKSLTDFISWGENIAENIADGINNFFKKTDWSNVGKFISTALVGAINIFDVLVKKTDWKQIGKSIADFILGIDWLEVGTELLDLLIDGMLAAMDLLAGITEGIIEKLTDPKFYVDLIDAGRKMASKIIEGFSDIKGNMQNIVISGLENIGVNKNDAEAAGKALGNGLYNGLKTVVTSSNPLLNNPIVHLGGSALKKLFGLAKGGIVYPKLPKLASGGIINMPGRGVPLGSAIGGERGAEAVVPLTDSQQMEILGKAIGKNVKINADITLELESRVLARVMKEVQNNYSFARNGG